MSFLSVLGVAVALAHSGLAQCPAPNATFVGDGLPGNVPAMAAFDDGGGPALYAVSEGPGLAGFSDKELWRWDGERWASLGVLSAPGSTEFADLAVHDDGGGAALYLGGRFADAAGVSASNVARWDGAAWSAVGAGLPSEVYSLASLDLGTGARLFAGGYAWGTVGVHVWDGSSWTPFGASFTAGRIVGLVTIGTTLYAAGSDSGVWTSDGGAWTRVGSPLPNPTHCLAALNTGAGPQLYAGTESGLFRCYNGIWTNLGGARVRSVAVYGPPSMTNLCVGVIPGGYPPNQVLRWTALGWTPLGGAGDTDGGVMELFVFDDGAGPGLFASGYFRSIQGTPARGIGKFDGAAWRPLGEDHGLTQLVSSGGSGGTATARAIVAYTPPGELQPHVVIGGRFDFAGGAPARNVAAWMGGRWRSLGEGLGKRGESVEGLVAFDPPGAVRPSLYAVGSFTGSGSTPAHGAARWNGQSWSKLGNSPAGGVGGIGRCALVFDDGSGAALYVGGSFHLVDGNIPANNVARWDGANWSALGAGFNGEVRALVSYDDPQLPGAAMLCAVGQFTHSSTPLNFVARWSGSSWVSVGSYPSTTPPTHAVVWDDGLGAGPELYVGGLADSAIWRWDGAGWSDIAASAGSSVGMPLAVFDDGSGEQLYAGTGWPTAKRWNGVQWSSIGAGRFADGALASIDEGGGRTALWLGTSSHVLSMPSHGVGRIADSCVPVASYCVAKTTSNGCVPAAGWSGAPSVSVGPFLLRATSVINQKTGLCFYGLSGRRSQAFLGGTLCVAQPLRRSALLSSGGNVGPDDCSGVLDFDFHALLAAGSDPLLAPGARVQAQFWFRDPADPYTSGLSDALEFSVRP